MGWEIVEVVVGLSFLFFLLSIVTSAVAEVVSTVFHLRARTLERGIKNLLTGTPKPDPQQSGIVNELYGHPLVSSYAKDTERPKGQASYMASRSFRNALLDVTGLLEATAVPSAADPLGAEEVRQAVEERIGAIPEPHLRDTLQTIWRSVDHDATEFRAGVERWFDRGMDRVSGWYKRRSQIILFVLGLVVAAVVNAGAIDVADHLWSSDGVRQGLVAQVEHQADNATGAEALDRLEQLNFPIGWAEANRPDGWGWATTAVGWVVTAFALLLGAPFWFDFLGKVSNLRAAGPKPNSTLTPAPSKAELNEVHLTVGSEPPATGPSV